MRTRWRRSAHDQIGEPILLPATRRTGSIPPTSHPPPDSPAPTPQPGTAAEPGDVTRLLDSWQDGREEALAELVPIVYGELRRLAASYLRRQRSDHTLQPTSLVNEAFLRLLGAARVRPHDRVHFFAFAARAMRQVLVDHARRKQASKREAEGEPVSLEVAGDLAAPQAEVDLLALNEALDRLAAIDERQARVVELRYFSGLSAEETAEVLGVSLSSVIRDWRVARLFLHRELSR